MSTAKKLTIQYTALLLSALVCLAGFVVHSGGSDFLSAYRDPALLAGFAGMAVAVGLMWAIYFVDRDL